MPQYQSTTRAQARQQLAAILDDPNNQFWEVEELNTLLNEALRTWAAYTIYWRETAAFPLTANQVFYDLSQPNVLTPLLLSTSGLLQFTITDSDLITAIQYALLEKPFPTSQFSTADILSALQRTRDQFLLDTGMVVARTVIDTVSPPETLVELPQNLLDVRRAAWIDAIAGYTTPMFRVDDWILLTYDTDPNLSDTPGIPSVYSIFGQRPLELRLSAPPLNPGQIDLLSVNSGPPLTGTGTVLGVPDNYFFAIKFGTLADLLSRDGEGRDPTRAAYCSQRYSEAIELARHYPSLVGADISGSRVNIDSFYDEDTYDSQWQNKPATSYTNYLPEKFMMGGLNIIAPVPIPPIDLIATVDVVRSAIIPAVDADYIQVSLSELDAIIEYARHLACFKMGGSEFSVSTSGFKQFQDVATTYAARLNANAPYAKTLKDRARLEAATHRRTVVKQVTTTVSS